MESRLLKTAFSFCVGEILKVSSYCPLCKNFYLLLQEKCDIMILQRAVMAT
jgi:hypothetical protein